MPKTLPILLTIIKALTFSLYFFLSSAIITESSSSTIALYRSSCTGNDCGLSFGNNSNPNSTYYTYLPSDFLNSGDSALKFALLADARLAQGSTYGANSITSVSINSPLLIVGISSPTLDTTHLPQPFTYSMRLLDPTQKQNPSCQYFDIYRNVWSTLGCTLITQLSSDSQIACNCTHMTSFAVGSSATITASSYTLANSQIIYFPTQVGGDFAISCLSLLVIALGLIALHGHLNFNRFIILQYAGSMLVSLSLFIFGVDFQPNDSGQCYAIAIFLHYFILVVFVWMTVEFWWYFQTFRQASSYQARKWTYIFSCIAAYGGPLVTVGAALLIHKNNDYYRADSCWISHSRGNNRRRLFTISYLSTTSYLINHHISLFHLSLGKKE